MTLGKAPPPAYLLRPELKVIWQELASRLGRGDQPTTLTLRSLDPSQQQAIADLLGLDRLPGSSLRLPLTKLMKACQIDDAAALNAIAEAVCGPVVDRKVERATRRLEKDNLWRWLRMRLQSLPYATTSRVDAWIDTQRANGISTINLEKHRHLYEQLLMVLAQLPANDRGLAVFAADVLGDPHALDSIAPLGRLSIDAFCVLNDLPSDRDADSWRRQWRWAGVSPDGVSSTVLAMGLQGSADASMSHWLSHTSKHAEPLVLTYRQLCQWPVNAMASDRFAIVLENPSLIEAAAQQGLTRIPLICSSGQPTLAVRLLISQLAAEGATVLQHADFDPAGMHITRWLRTHLNTKPWKMTSQHYLNAIDALSTPALSTDTNAVPETPWDCDLQPAMTSRRITISEEQVLADLLDGIRKLQTVPAAGSR